MGQEPKSAFEALTEGAKSEVLRVAGPAFLSAPIWAQNSFLKTFFCPWGCGMQMVCHDGGDPVCERRQVERYKDQPPGACLVYLPREHADRAVAEGKADLGDFADAGDGYMKLRIRLIEKDSTGETWEIGSRVESRRTNSRNAAQKFASHDTLRTLPTAGEGAKANHSKQESRLFWMPMQGASPRARVGAVGFVGGMKATDFLDTLVAGGRARHLDTSKMCPVMVVAVRQKDWPPKALLCPVPPELWDEIVATRRNGEEPTSELHPGDVMMTECGKPLLILAPEQGDEVLAVDLTMEEYREICLARQEASPDE